MYLHLFPPVILLQPFTNKEADKLNRVRRTKGVRYTQNQQHTTNTNNEILTNKTVTYPIKIEGNCGM